MAVSDLFWARGDSSSAGNSSVNVDGLNKFDSVQIQFSDSSTGDPLSGNGDLKLEGSVLGDYDSDTWVKVGDGTWEQFTLEFSGSFAYDPQLVDVNGHNLVGSSVAVITTESGERLFFFREPLPGGEATIDAMLSKEFSLDLSGEITDPIWVCFAKGTRIRCQNIDVFVENLNIGDLITNANGTTSEIRWIGKRTVSASEIKRKQHLSPVRIRAGALGNGLPTADLVVSQQHRMLLENWQVELMFGVQNALAAAKHLVNDHSILLDPPEDGVEYYHILFDQHEIIYANDALTESFHPGQWALDGLGNDTRKEIFELFPELKDSADNYGPTAHVVLKSYEVKSLLSLN